MRATVEPLEGNKVKLSVEIDEAEVEKAVDAAFRRIAREVRLPGFRPGKAPRRLLEARLGTGVAREEALREALPDYYERAVIDQAVDVIAAPEIDITSGQEDGPVQFDAVVQVRPVVTVGGYDSLRITLERPEPTYEEIDRHIDRLREQHAELVPVDRPAQDGDQVTIDISGSQHDVPMAGLTAADYLYEVGSATVVAELDDELRGAKVGDILSFTADHPDPDEDPVAFRILVKGVQEQRLPEADDAWAAKASEFDTVDELRADLTKRLSMVKRAQLQMARSEKTGAALAGLVTDELPDALVNEEMQRRLQDLALRLQAQGMTLEQYVERSGRTQEDFVAELRTTADQSARVDLALRALVEAEGVEVTDEDLEEELASVAERVGEKTEAVRERFERGQQMALVRSDLAKRKALEWLLERVELVDEAGDPIDRASLEIVSEDEFGDGADSDTSSEPNAATREATE